MSSLRDLLRELIDRIEALEEAFGGDVDDDDNESEMN